MAKRLFGMVVMGVLASTALAAEDEARRAQGVAGAVDLEGGVGGAAAGALVVVGDLIKTQRLVGGGDCRADLIYGHGE